MCLVAFQQKQKQKRTTCSFFGLCLVAFQQYWRKNQPLVHFFVRVWLPFNQNWSKKNHWYVFGPGSIAFQPNQPLNQMGAKNQPMVCFWSRFGCLSTKPKPKNNHQFLFLLMSTKLNQKTNQWFIFGPCLVAFQLNQSQEITTEPNRSEKSTTVVHLLSMSTKSKQKN